ncbi:MAG: hypothetical protein GY783_18650 [Gammaproteobacteria bacterium]|nr:hypothetical protein [Gammaproteobacteria bacterium]
MQFTTASKIVSGLTLILLLLYQPQTAEACSCAAFPDDLEKSVAIAFNRADVIFLGDVQSVRNKLLRMPPQREAAFSMRDLWKGTIPDTTLVRTNIGETACGYNFKKRGSYLVFAYWDRKRKHLSTSFCELTRTEAEANDAMVILDRIRKNGR